MDRIAPNLQILPGVKAIGWIDCSQLQPRVDLHGICMIRVPVLTTITPVVFFGEPDCRCTRSRESGRKAVTATLKFRSGDVLPLHVPLGFVVTDQNYRTFLIGSREHPQPVVKIEQTAGQCVGDAAGYEYEVSHTALATLIECVATY